MVKAVKKTSKQTARLAAEKTKNPPHDYLKMVLNAKVYDVAIKTPLDFANNLSTRIKNNIYLKREDMQPVFSFKLRGAYNKMANLSPAVLQRGVICASAGNHAQGVALAANRLGVRAVIVMPTTTPQIKVDNVLRYGGEAVLFGDSYSDAYSHALELEKKHKLSFVHPFDDPYTIAGQGTVAMEILNQQQGPIDAIFVCIGGGGLISGVAAYVKALRPEIKIIGVEAEGADAMQRSLKSGRRITLEHVALFADGAAVKHVGAETFRLCRELVDEVIVVSNDEICAAIKDVFEDTRSILEPAGALGVAGVKAYCARQKLVNKTFVAIASGANMNFDRLRFVSERAELGEHREAVLAVTIPEIPGSFRRFCELLGSRSITEFNYRFADEKQAHIYIGIATTGHEDVTRIVRLIGKNGLPVLDLTDDELAKTHLRHMVGGRAPQIKNELLYRFSFPERPGALMKFLDSLRSDWNISLFHYRNHGSDFGRVLVGMQVPKSDRKAFNEFLKELGYEYENESNNPAYQLFLGNN